MAHSHGKTYKHGLYYISYRLERHSTVNPLATYDCIMFDGDCDCNSFEECKYLDKLKEE